MCFTDVPEHMCVCVFEVMHVQTCVSVWKSVRACHTAGENIWQLCLYILTETRAVKVLCRPEDVYMNS